MFSRRGLRVIAWLIPFLVLAVIAYGGWLIPLDREISGSLKDTVGRLSILNLVWVVGGVPVTGLVVLATALARRQGRWLALFLLGTFVEVLTKHWISTPMPSAVPEAHWLSWLEARTNPSPSWTLATLRHLLGIHPQQGAGHPFLLGSFFSGHVFRITFVVGMLSRYQPLVTPMSALVASVLVVALGGHWAIDAAGAFCIASVLLAFTSESRRTSRR